MSDDDRRRWDARYASAPSVEPVAPAAWPDGWTADGGGRRALDVACGSGAVSVWLALAGYAVTGVDVSPVAVERAAALAAEHGVTERCRFEVVDLDDGLTAAVAVLGHGPSSLDVIVCQRFRMPAIYPELVELLVSGGVLALTVLSVVGHDGEAGPFRAAPGELTRVFSPLLTVEVDRESDGEAHLFARR